MTRILRSTPITALPHYYDPVRLPQRSQYCCSLVPWISHVLFQCLYKGHAVCITVGAQPVIRCPLHSSLSPSHKTVLHHNFRDFVTSSTVHFHSSPSYLLASLKRLFSIRSLPPPYDGSSVE